jgi:cytochrome P450
MTEPINLFAPDVRRDPYPIYARLRDAPVQQVEPGGFWAVSRHEDVEHVLKNPQVFSSAGFEALLKPSWLSHNPLADSILTKDGPAHAKLRALVSRAFAPRAIARLEPRVRVIAAELAGRLVTLGEADFVREFAVPFTGRVIVEILGVDPALTGELKEWTRHLSTVSPIYPGDDLANAIRATVSKMEGYLKEVVDARRRAPVDDTVSDLVRAEIDGSALTDEEIIAFLFLLLQGGFGTTQHLLCAIVLGFMERPDDLAELRADRSRIAAYVEESLRKEPSVHGILRLTTVDAEIGGVKVPRGSMVLLLPGSANHDPSVFSAPERFDAGRRAQGNLAFGHGAHFCLGAPLARLQARIAIEELASHFRGFELLRGEIEYNFSAVERGPLSLPIRVHPA